MSDESAPDDDIGHGIQVATWVHAAITSGGASAWHYWWLVAINPGTSSATFPVFVSGGQALTQVTPYVTSATENLAAQAAITVTAANFTSTLAAQTVTTFVGN